MWTISRGEFGMEFGIGVNLGFWLGTVAIVLWRMRGGVV